ncbi:MAG TPA: pitrilysin family protein [Myxococcaceae bacterium]|nr:pitrilysin family protein [Myxococcaceae bacterium]
MIFPSSFRLARGAPSAMAGDRLQPARFWASLAIFVLFALASSCATSTASSKTSNPLPTATAQSQSSADSAPVSDGDVTFATVHGMQVFIKRIPGAELVSGQLDILGGVRNWGKEDAGVEQLALTVSASGGTETLDKDAFARRLATLGSMIAAGAGNDASSFRAKSLKENWDTTFELMVDAFLHPGLPPKEVELQRQQQLSALRHEQEDPDAQLALIAHERIFKNHPYENRSIGTLETVNKLTRDQLRSHLAKLRETSRLILVVVGDVEPDHIITRARDLLGHLPLGTYRHTPMPPIRFDQPTVTTVAKKLPTNYILSSFPGPGWKDEDFALGMVAMTVLGWRQWIEVRTKRNLSYAPSAGMATNAEVTHGLLYVTAVDPNATMKVMLDEARNLKERPVPAPELKGDVSTLVTSFIAANETTDGQAALLARAQVLGGDWRLIRTLPDRMRAVTSEGIEQFARKYIANLQTVVLGDPERIDPALFSSL